MQKQSFGMGHGLNKGISGAGSLGAAVPPMRSVSVKPGCGKQLPGSASHGKHFQGAKVFSPKK